LGLTTEEGSITDIKTPSTSEGNSKINGTNRLVHEKLTHDTGDEIHMTSTVMETFQELKASIDYYISQYKLAGCSDSVIPKQTEMRIVHILDAFDQIGFSLQAAQPGQNLKRVPYPQRE
jgi:hypothetical protein